MASVATTGNVAITASVANTASAAIMATGVASMAARAAITHAVRVMAITA